MITETGKQIAPDPKHVGYTALWGTDVGAVFGIDGDCYKVTFERRGALKVKPEALLLIDPAEIEVAMHEARLRFYERKRRESAGVVVFGQHAKPRTLVIAGDVVVFEHVGEVRITHEQDGVVRLAVEQPADDLVRWGADGKPKDEPYDHMDDVREDAKRR